jgi:hypothetical protein
MLSVCCVLRFRLCPVAALAAAVTHAPLAGVGAGALSQQQERGFFGFFVVVLAHATCSIRNNREKYPKCSLVLVVIRQERKKKKQMMGPARAPSNRHHRGGKERHGATRN